MLELHDEVCKPLDPIVKGYVWGPGKLLVVLLVHVVAVVAHVVVHVVGHILSKCSTRLGKYKVYRYSILSMRILGYLNLCVFIRFKYKYKVYRYPILSIQVLCT